MSQWGLWGHELDAIQRHDLIRSYARRQRWEARMMAVEISKLFGSSDKKEEPPKPAKEITTDDFFKMVGAKVKHVHTPG